MSLRSTLGGLLNGLRSPDRGRARSAQNSALYEGGSQTRRTIGWRAPTTSANQAVLASLTVLRDRSRAATRNDGYAKSVVDKWVTNIVGLGIQARSKAVDPAIRTAVNDLWLRWTYESDADGLLEWEGQVTQAVRTWLEGGEAFARFRSRLPQDGLAVPFQVQILEPEHCPHAYTVLSGAARVRAGIEFDAVGRRIAYYFHPSRPEQDDFDASQLRRVPSDSVVHMYDPLRPGQLRGIPLLTQAMVALNELSKYSDATMLRQQLANMFVAFVTRAPGAAGAEALNPLTGQPVERTSENKPMLAMEPGIFQELDEGENVTFSDPPDAGGFPDFMRQQLYAVAAATGVPYEVLTGDMRGVNDRTVRVVLNEFRRRVQVYQHQIVAAKLCRPTWMAWFRAAYLSGALDLPSDYLQHPERYDAVEWQPQAFPYIHPVQDVDAQAARVRNGFESRAAIVAENGGDIEAVDAAQADDNTRADALRLKHDSDGRFATGAVAPSAPLPEPDSETQPAGVAA